MPFGNYFSSPGKMLQGTDTASFETGMAVYRPTLDEKLAAGRVVKDAEAIREYVEMLRSGNVEEFNSRRQSNNCDVIDFSRVLPRDDRFGSMNVYEDLVQERTSKIAGSNLSYVILKGSDFRGFDLGDVVFDDSRLYDCDFRSYAGFGRTNMDGDSFYRADLAKSDFRDSNIYRTRHFGTVSGEDVDIRGCVRAKHIDDWTTDELFELYLEGDPDWPGERGVQPQTIGLNMSFSEFLRARGYSMSTQKLARYKVTVLNGNYCGAYSRNFVNLDPENMLVLGYDKIGIRFEDIFKGDVYKSRVASIEGGAQANRKSLPLHGDGSGRPPSAGRDISLFEEGKLVPENNKSHSIKVIKHEKHDESAFITHGGVYSKGPVLCQDAHLMGDIVSASTIIFAAESFPRGIVAAENIFLNKRTFRNHAEFARGNIIPYEGGF